MVGAPRSYSQLGITASMSESPLGKPPVLNSRRENSTWLGLGLGLRLGLGLGLGLGFGVGVGVGVSV